MLFRTLLANEKYHLLCKLQLEAGIFQRIKLENLDDKPHSRSGIIVSKIHGPLFKKVFTYQLSRENCHYRK